MGLSGAKRRTKLSSDPNNTAWSKSTDGFGHKILSAQGWKPGQLLGAENAAHAEHFTAANASHIRVMLREDNLGLGAQLGKSNAGSFGLSTLSGIFGRLNGKSDADVEKQQSAQRDIELRAYQTRKFGQMTFVSGGLLLGDKMEELDDMKSSAAKQRTTEKQQPIQEPTIDADEPRKTKRKYHEVIADDSMPKKKRPSSRKEAKARAATYTLESPVERVDVPSENILEESSLKQRGIDKAAKLARKAERRARKEDKQKRREERALRKDTRKKHKSTSVTPSVDVVAQITIEETPATARPPMTAFGGSRQAVRQRFIQQKRLASMDTRALNEILMLKTAVV